MSLSMLPAKTVDAMRSAWFKQVEDSLYEGLYKESANKRHIKHDDGSFIVQSFHVYLKNLLDFDGVDDEAESDLRICEKLIRKSNVGKEHIPGVTMIDFNHPWGYCKAYLEFWTMVFA